MMTVWKNLNAAAIGKFTNCSRILLPDVLNLGKTDSREMEGF